MSKPEVLAVLCSDIHLSERPPLARSKEPDWYKAMAGQLMQLNDIADQHNAPIICGGDVFDRWKSSPELINFAINNLPTMWSIAGQHDLPMHQLDDIRKSAFWTLVECGKIKMLGRSAPEWNMRVNGFSWGVDTCPDDSPTSAMKVVVAHKYVWHGEAKYQGADRSQSATACKGMFKGYDVALLGDNHKSWKTRFGKCLVYNPGSFFRRHSDEIDHLPQVGLLKSTGEVTVSYLDVSKDVIEQTEKRDEKEVTMIELTKFVEGLKGLGEEGVSFEEALKFHLEKENIDKNVCVHVLEALHEATL